MTEPTVEEISRARPSRQAAVTFRLKVLVLQAQRGIRNLIGKRHRAGDQQGGRSGQYFVIHGQSLQSTDGTLLRKSLNWLRRATVLQRLGEADYKGAALGRGNATMRAMSSVNPAVYRRAWRVVAMGNHICRRVTTGRP